MLVVVPDPASPDLARTLDLAGYSWKAVAAGSAVSEHEPQGGWAGAIVDATTDPEGAWSFLRAMRKHADASMPGHVARRAGASCPSSNIATTCSTTSVSRRSIRPSSRLACDTCSHPTSTSSVPTSSSTPS